MKRTSKKAMVSGILALSMVLAGTGYAYWTDTLNVTTRANTGELDVVFADLGLFAQYDNEEYLSTWSIWDDIDNVSNEFFQRGASDYTIIAKGGTQQQYEDSVKGWSNVTFNAQYGTHEQLKKDVGTDYTVGAVGTASSDQIILTINNMYPGYAQLFRTDILNHGTIAAKLSNLKFGINDEALSTETMDLLGIQLAMVAKDGQASLQTLTSLFNNNPGAIFEVGGQKFVRLSALDDEYFFGENGLFTLKAYAAGTVRDDLDLYVGVAMDPDACGKNGTTGYTGNLNTDAVDANSQKQNAEVTIDFGWDQFNATACPETES